MSETGTSSQQAGASMLEEEPPVGPHRGRWRFAEALSFRKIGAVYILIVIIIIFSFWAPTTFPRWATAQQILDGNSILALAALALVVPLSAGVFDLSTAYTISLTGVIVAQLVANENFSLAPAIVVALATGLLIGIVNGVIVVGFRIDSFIGTLASGSLIMAVITAVSQNENINSPKLLGPFSNLAQGELWNLTFPVYYAIALAIILWYVMSHTPVGRRLYATGFNKNAALLARIRSDRLQFWSLVTSSGIAGITGIIVASSIGAGQPDVGTSYLLPAFAAVFLGATQLTEGRFNAGGTVIAVLLLGAGTTGLGLTNAPQWAQSAFSGVVLIAALAVTGMQRRRVGAGPLFPRLWRRARNNDEPQQSSQQPVS
jgi:ribose transport system permease protein